MSDLVPIRRALLSVSDKRGIISLARALQQLGIALLSTGGTAKLLAENDILHQEVSDYTGFPEMMDGRVKTLHPKVHGGLLGRRGIDDAIMQAHEILPIDLVIVNLYPFDKTITQADCTLEAAIEQIDIGGPTMLRAAAKNHRSVTAVVNPDDYDSVIQQLTTQHNALSAQARFDLAVKTFEHTAAYDAMIANALGAYWLQQNFIGTGRTINLQFHLKETLRYGENPHQSAAFYTELPPPVGTVSSARQLSGKPLSYNNIADTDAALECVKQFSEPACVIVKHANPCGVALGKGLLDAYEKAYQTDPTSAFGGIIAFNRTLDAETAKIIIAQQFVEVIIAPEISEAALEIIIKKPNIRLLSCGQWTKLAAATDYKKVAGGLLIQSLDQGQIIQADLNIVTKRSPTDAEIADLLFSWQVAKFVKSNAIVLAKNAATVGIGAGQMSRVYSTKIAAIKAQDEGLIVAESVMASDAFFPFRDGIDQAAQVGVRAIIQPGGSMRDQEVIEAANEHNIAMVFTGMRHFRH